MLRTLIPPLIRIVLGALVGAQVGLSGIPVRFIDGLAEGQEIVALAQNVAAAASHGNEEIQST